MSYLEMVFSVESIIATVSGATIGALTKYFGKADIYRWWRSWVPDLKNRHWKLTGIAGLLGGLIAFLIQLLVSTFTSSLPVALGGAAGMSLVTAMLLNSNPATLGAGILGELPFKPIKLLIVWFEKSANKRVRKTINRTIRDEFLFDDLDELVNLCENLHSTGLKDYGDPHMQRYRELELKICREKSQNKKFEVRNEALGLSQALATQLIDAFKITRENVFGSTS